jgi:hypothetical protein
MTSLNLAIANDTSEVIPPISQKIDDFIDLECGMSVNVFFKAVAESMDARAAHFDGHNDPDGKLRARYEALALNARACANRG